MCKCSGKCGCNITQITTGEKGDPSSGSTLGYKVYVALLTQSSTDAPTAIVLQNTLGAVPSYSRTAQGAYSITCPGKFTLSKTIFNFGLLDYNVSDGGDIMSVPEDRTVNLYSFRTYDTGNTPTDSLLNETYLEIRVYP